MKKIGFRRLIALAVIVLGSANLFGWSAEGHETVANIAQALLTQSGQFAPVQAILGNLTLAQISVCPDELRAFQIERHGHGRCLHFSLYHAQPANRHQRMALH